MLFCMHPPIPTTGVLQPTPTMYSLTRQRSAAPLEPKEPLHVAGTGARACSLDLRSRSKTMNFVAGS